MVYIEDFQFPNEERRVYPYHLLSKKGLENMEFAPITILYGNNGSGKSTILNMIAERLDIRNITLGSTNEYFSSCVRKCSYTLGEKGIPDDSMMIRSEDIMHYIANIRKRNADIDKVVQGWLMKGLDKSKRGTLDAEYMVRGQFETIYDCGGGNSSFHAVMVNKLAETNLHNIRIDRNLLIIAFIVVSALLLLALLYVLYRQTMMQTKINRTIRQVEDVQEAIQLNHRDAAFAERMRQIVDSHLTDPKLNVEYLATALQLDRTQVFRRVKSVTGKGPAEYIREQRLIRANEQLRTTDKSIRQIANELCFSSPGYFSKYYKDYFGHLPSEQ